MKNSTSNAGCIALILAALASCATAPAPMQPLLVITEGWPQFDPRPGSVLSPQDFISQLNSGQATFGDALVDRAMQASSCVFAADFSGSTAPQMIFGGMPGDAGFNVQYAAPALVPNAASTQPCPREHAPTDLAISPGAGVVLNQYTRGNIAVVVNGETFSDQTGFSEFRVSTYDAANNVAAGDFRAALRNIAVADDPRVMMAVGSFRVRVDQH